MSDATTVSDTKREDENRGCNFGTIWDACCSTVFRVVTEEGGNVGDARIRHLQGRYWLYVDDTDGYEVMPESEAKSLHLVPN